MKNLVLMVLFTLVAVSVHATNNNKLAQLQEIIIEFKLLPTPAGVGGKNARFGESVSIDGNRALIGSPRALEHGVAYIYDYDGTTWNETQLIFPDDIDANNRFGISVSLQGNRALIGDRYNRVNGVQQSGAVFVYDLSNGVWEFTQKLIASDAGGSDEFGISVSLSGDRALIGAVNYDDVTNGSNAGAAYIFDYDGTMWQETMILTATSGSSNDNFGNAVSLDGNMALVGSQNFDDNNNTINTGSAYLFELNTGTWAQTKQFLASDGVDNDKYGIAVSVSANRVLIGASDTDENVNTSGSAYVYEYDGSMWVETKLLAPDAASGDRFGVSVAIENNRLLVGARSGEVNGVNTGSAYIYDYNLSLNIWGFTQEISADDITSNNFFASSVGLSGDKVIVGNFGDRDNGSQSGAAYVFDLDGAGTWQQTQKLVTLGAVGDNFGYAISLDGNRALIGAPFDVVDGSARGAAYIFDFVNGQWSNPIKLFASDLSANFGSAVDLDNNNAIIAANGVNNFGTGTVYIYNFDGTSWNEVALLDSGVVANDEYGISVSISADKALVGAFVENNNGTNSGSVYVYENLASTWQFTDKLLPSDAQPSDAFGYSVNLLGNRALVGAYTKDDDINNRSRAGAAYIYDYDADNDLWVETKLQALVTSSSGFFGFDVDLGQDRVIIGATGNSQKAYIFDYDNVTDSWDGVELSSVSSGSNQFGHSVSLDNNRVLIGAQNTTINGEQFVGAAHQFDFDNSVWSETKIYTASDALRRDFYGWSVSLSAGKALIGANESNASGTDSGSVYSYVDDLIFANGFE